MKWLILLILLIPCIYASEMYVDVTITPNDIVNEDITLFIVGNYTSIEFGTLYKPLHILADDYSITGRSNGYSIRFPFTDELKFSLLYNNLIDKINNKRIFRTVYSPDQVDVIYVNLTLPPYYILSEKQPNIIPKPDQILTNGQQIRLVWTFDEETELSVFYEKQKSNNYLIIPAILLVVFLLIIFFISRKHHKKIDAMLSSEEQKVLQEIKKGIDKQNKIAMNLQFSKSKMSKIVRKLEEKKLIKKEPYFRTNILKKI